MVEDREIALTTKEFDLFALLESERGSVVTRERLMGEVWDENWFGSTKTLDVTMGRLRQKLEEAGAQEEITTIRGVGFRLERPVPGA
jgi:DNA-binding response OmpR family regulator